MSENLLGNGLYDPFYDPASFIGNDMKDIFAEYTDTLSNGQRQAFVELNDISRKVNGVCYEWAEIGGTFREQAVRLRGLHIIRALERFIHSGNRRDVKDYHASGIIPGDDFWPRVEDTTYNLLERLMNEAYGVEFKPEPPVENVNGRTKQRLAKAHGYELGRYLFRSASSELSHFAYLAAHKRRKEFRSQAA